MVHDFVGLEAHEGLDDQGVLVLEVRAAVLGARDVGGDGGGVGCAGGDVGGAGVIQKLGRSNERFLDLKEGVGGLSGSARHAYSARQRGAYLEEQGKGQAGLEGLIIEEAIHKG